jgi:putative ABC transport system substrate-binding protein
MITGLTSLAGNITDKYLELLLDVTPTLRRVGFLIDSTVLTASSHMEAARRSGTRLSVEVHFAEVARPEDIERGIARMTQEGIRALVIMPSTIFAANRRHLMPLALAHRLPVVAQTHEYAEAGALLSYGADPSALYRRAAYFVDRILKGAKPGDLPIEQPTQFELVINLKTAKALGLTVPKSVLLRADRVIE